MDPTMPTPEEHDTTGATDHGRRHPGGLHDRVRAAVGEEHWPAVFELLNAKDQAWGEEIDLEVYAMIDGIAAHFPAFGPAIRAVGRHIYETGSPEDCGLMIGQDEERHQRGACVGPAVGREGAS